VKISLPALGPDLPVHPRTGLMALGLRRNGDPIWPVRGGSGEGEPAGDGGNGGEGGQNDGKPPADLGDAGKKALDAMKAERNAARKELADMKGKLESLAPLQKLAEALGAKPADDGKTDFEALTQRIANHEQELAGERLARFRAEVAAEKKLTVTQAKRLVGVTREELLADAEELLKDLQPAGDSGTRGQSGPRPDRSQGARGNQPASGREQALAEIQKRFGKKPPTT
jgi:hypothetical protein